LFSQCVQNVVDDRYVAAFIERQYSVDLLNRRFAGVLGELEIRVTDDQPMSKRALRIGYPWINLLPRGTELHVKDRLVPVSSVRRGGQSDDEAGLYLGQDALERDCRQVMTLVHDHLSVLGHNVVDGFFSRKALDHGHIDHAGHLSPAAANLSDRLRGDAETDFELSPPLFEQGLPMNKNQGVCLPRGQEVDPSTVLPVPGGAARTPVSCCNSALAASAWMLVRSLRKVTST